MLDLDSEHGKQYKQSEIVKLNRTSMVTVAAVVKSFSQGDLATVMTIARSEASNHANQKSYLAKIKRVFFVLLVSSAGWIQAVESVFT